MGKTWAVAEWAYRMFRERGVPVLFAVSSDFQDADPEGLLSKLLRRSAPSGTQRTEEYWRRLADRWRKGRRFRAVVVLDGLNEWAKIEDARLLLTRWLADEDQSRCALQLIAPLIITCRKVHWDRCISAQCRHSTIVEVGPYNDTEVDIALRKHGLTRRDIPSNVQQIIRHPRYLDLAASLRDELRDFSNVTPRLLVYKDMEHKHRQNPTTLEKLGFSGLDVPQNFADLLRQLADRARADGAVRGARHQRGDPCSSRLLLPDAGTMRSTDPTTSLA
jgi:hypothetical protein